MRVNFYQRVLRFGLVLSLSPLIGCGGPTSAKVSGRVLLEGQPLPGGRITFRPANPAANSVSVEIDEKGQYEVVLPIGDVLVSVDNRELAPRAARGPIEIPGLAPDVQSKLATTVTRPTPTPTARKGHYVPIATRYHDAVSAGLGFTVTTGEQQHDFQLTP